MQGPMMAVFGFLLILIATTLAQSQSPYYPQQRELNAKVMIHQFLKFVFVFALAISYTTQQDELSYHRNSFAVSI